VGDPPSATKRKAAVPRTRTTMDNFMMEQFGRMEQKEETIWEL
jgi:hypothetical protein